MSIEQAALETANCNNRMPNMQCAFASETMSSASAGAALSRGLPVGFRMPVPAACLAVRPRRPRRVRRPRARRAYRACRHAATAATVLRRLCSSDWKSYGNAKSVSDCESVFQRKRWRQGRLQSRIWQSSGGTLPHESPHERSGAVVAYRRATPDAFPLATALDVSF